VVEALRVLLGSQGFERVENAPREFMQVRLVSESGDEHREAIGQLTVSQGLREASGGVSRQLAPEDHHERLLDSVHLREEMDAYLAHGLGQRPASGCRSGDGGLELDAQTRED
jgi:hypothetical protein